MRLSVAADPSGKGAHDVIVVPIADEESLRLRAWMEDNRRKVRAPSAGRLAYVYLPDTAVGGYTNFNRYYFAQVQPRRRDHRRALQRRRLGRRLHRGLAEPPAA